MQIPCRKYEKTQKYLHAKISKANRKHYWKEKERKNITQTSPYEWDDIRLCFYFKAYLMQISTFVSLTVAINMVRTF